MSGNNDIVTTSISISKSLYKAAKIRAAREYRSFSQHVSYLIDADLRREKKKSSSHTTEEIPDLPTPPSPPATQTDNDAPLSGEV